MCRILSVKRNGYYRFQKHRRNKSEDLTHQTLLQCVKDIDVASDHSYGSRRMQQALNGCGYSFGRDRTSCLMKEADVQVRYRKKYKMTTNSQHSQPVFNNLPIRQFEVDQPNRVYVSDIACFWTQEGLLYLAVVPALNS
jgi:putative transposase